jgi:predicted N-formylglutamate amidohydrolase
VSCEHGGNRIPAPYGSLFEDYESRGKLASHRGFDEGALVLATELAHHYGVPAVTATVSRLLIDLNRSLDNPRVYSQQTRSLPPETRARIVADYYRPYRDQLEALVRQGVERGLRIVHISCHSFTPELDGRVRDADVGLLYDPVRAGELDFSVRWQKTIRALCPELKVRRNYPYAGKNDGLTRHLRSRFSDDQYLGIELEINQKHVANEDSAWLHLRSRLIRSVPI